MDYQIRHHSGFKQTPIDIDETRYKEVLAAKDNAIIALRSEQRLAIVVQNYFELEQLFLRFSLEEMCSKPYSRSVKFIPRLVDADRVICNLLSSCRMLIDQHKHALKTLFGMESHEYTRFNEKYVNFRKTDFTFSLTEHCRNISQHASLILSGLSYKGLSHFTNENKSYREMTSMAMLAIETILADEEVQEKWPEEWQQKLAEIEEYSITLLIREYLEKIWHLHAVFSTFTHELFTNSCETIESVIHEWESTNEPLKEGQGLFIGPSGSDVFEGDFVTKYLTQQFKTLQDQWLLHKLSEKFVSSHPNPQSIDLRNHQLKEE